MQERWTAFAHGDEPDADGEPAWPAYRVSDGADARATLVIERHDAIVADLDGTLRAAWGDDVLDFR